MKSTINLSGELHVYAETELEGYAMNQWADQHFQKDINSNSVIFHGHPSALKEIDPPPQRNK